MFDHTPPLLAVTESWSLILSLLSAESFYLRPLSLILPSIFELV